MYTSKPNSYKGAGVSTLASTDGHLVIDGGVVSKSDSKQITIEGDGWVLAIATSAIQPVPFGYLLPAEPVPAETTAKAAPKAKAKVKKTKSRKKTRKPHTTRNRRTDALVIKLLGQKEPYKNITQRTGYGSSLIVRVRKEHLAAGGKPLAAVKPSHGRQQQIPDEQVKIIERWIADNAGCTAKDIEHEFKLSNGTAWRLKNGTYCVQMNRKQS